MSLNLPTATISAALLFLFLCGPSLAQQRGLTVQLPTVRQYQNSSQYLIPDGGTSGSGGISRSASGSRSGGLLVPNRSNGNRASQGQSSVSAWILSNREINEDILAGASPARSTPMPYYKEVWLRQRNARLSQQK